MSIKIEGDLFLSRLGLVFSGGGARGAYQAGAFKAFVEILNQQKMTDKIKVLTGISAGSINASYLACQADNWDYATDSLNHLWSSIVPSDIYRTDIGSLGSIGLRLIADVTIGSFKKKKLASALLDHSPLKRLLNDNLDFNKLEKNIEDGFIDALGCSAFDYDDSMIRVWVQGKSDLKPWNKSRRKSEFVNMKIAHIMASASIPVIFPAVKVDGHYFGDGSLRNVAPISPAIHLGAEKVIILGVKSVENVKGQLSIGEGRPSLGKVLGLMLNSLFFDSIENDVDRLNHINRIVSMAKGGLSGEMTGIRPVPLFWVRPSVDIGALASKFLDKLPTQVRYLLGGLGGNGASSDLASYLMFVPEFTKLLIENGYSDVYGQKEKLIAFLNENP